VSFAKSSVELVKTSFLSGDNQYSSVEPFACIALMLFTAALQVRPRRANRARGGDAAQWRTRGWAQCGAVVRGVL
jgi:hypothetical protein